MYNNPPKNWKIYKLKELYDIKRGGSPRPIEKFLTTDPDGINWIKIGDAKIDSKYIEETKEKITVEGAAKSRFVEEGDFILSNSMSFGRPYIMKTRGCIHDGWLVLKERQDGLIFKDFMYYILSSENVYSQFKNAAAGGVVRNLNIQRVENVIVPIPQTLAEQQEIVQVLDTMNDIIRLRKECISHAQDLIPALFQEMFKPYANCTKTVLNNLFEFKSGGTPSKQVEEYFQGDIPWITTVALSKLYINEDDANELITEEAIQNSSTKLIPANSLLFGTRVGIGKLAINTVPMCTNQDIVAMIPLENNNLNLIYVYWYLKQINNFFVANGRGATIQGITTHLVRSTEIILPPLKIQEQFAQKAIEIEAYIKEQQEELANAKQMFQSLLHHAFTGELTRRAYGKN